MKRINHSLRALGLLFFSLVLLGACSDEPELFPDTAENKALFENAQKHYAAFEAKHGRYVQVNGLRMHYLEFGDSAGMPFIFVPGSGGTAYQLLNVAEGLAEKGYRVFALDPRAHGQSRTADLHFSIQHVADDIVAMMDTLGIERAVMAGLSKGGFVATAVYDEYPERVSGLLLEDGGSWSDQRLRENINYGFIDRVTELGSLLQSIVPEDPFNQVREGRFEEQYDLFKFLMMAGLATGNDVIPMEQLALSAMSYMWKDGDVWVYHMDAYKLMGHPEPGIFMYPATKQGMLQWSQQALIPEIVFRHLDVPMLIIDPVSEDDEYPVSADNEALTKQHPELIRHQIYKDTPHGAHFFRPEWFLNDAAKLLQRIKEHIQKQLTAEKPQDTSGADK